MSAFERAEEDIQKRYADGEITNDQMWEETKELYREYREAAREASQAAYDREMNNW